MNGQFNQILLIVDCDKCGGCVFHVFSTCLAHYQNNVLWTQRMCILFAVCQGVYSPQPWLTHVACSNGSKKVWRNVV